MNLGWQQIHRGMKLKRVVGGGENSGDRGNGNGGGGRKNVMHSTFAGGGGGRSQSISACPLPYDAVPFL
jgi:hypothetical protein